MEDIMSQITSSPLKLGAVAASLIAFGYIYTKAACRSEKYPPGPPRDPFIGNLRQFPKSRMSDAFSRWAKEYGPIVYVTLPGISLVVLNSYEVAQDLLSKRTNTTSGRKIGYMIKEIMGWQWSLAFIDPGPSHSNQRKMLRKGIGPQRIGSHNHLIEGITAKSMLTLHDAKGDPHELILKAMGRIVLEVVYGTEITKRLGEGLTSWNLEAMDMVNESFFEFWFVDIFHSLRFIPSWFPGARFKRIGRRSTWLSDQLRYRPFEAAKELYSSGTLGHCLAADLLDEFGPQDDVRDTLAILYSAGADTTTAAIMAFLHTMFLFPKVAETVYEEIERVTNGERMPTVTDRPNFPFTEAAWKEAWRWRPFFPLGMPHVNTHDEIVSGFFIPKGTLINLNNQHMLTDPDVWGDPEVFRPERFLERDNLPNPMTIVFGYGMRICPGMYLADRAGFHIAATIIALYKVLPLEGAEVPDPRTVEYADTMFQLPIGFKCQFVPRNDKVKHLLKVTSLDD